MKSELAYKIHTSIFIKIVRAYIKGGNSIKKNGKKKNFSGIAGYTFTDFDIDLLEHFELESFIVGQIGNEEVLELLKKLGTDYIKTAGKNQEGIKDFYKKYVADAQEIIARYIPDSVDKMPAGGWIATNIRDGISSAYHGSRWNAVQEYLDVYVALQKHTKGDNKVRPKHAEFDKMIFLLADSITKKMISPLDHNCRCDDEYLTQDELDARASTLMSDENKGTVLLNVKRTKAQEKALLQKFGVNPDFAINVTETKSIYYWIGERLNKFPASVQRKIKKNVREYVQLRKTASKKSQYSPAYMKAVVSNNIKFKPNRKYLSEILEKEIK